MKKILFPTDFSETANNAFLYALNLAENQNAELYILHAFQYPIVNAGIDAGILQNVYDTIELNKFENLKDHIPFLRKMAEDNGFSNIDLKFIIKEGMLSFVLPTFIEEEKVDFVVMGTTGNTGFDKVLFGSNTMNAIKHLKIPVLSVPHGYEYKGIKSIGFTTIFEDKDRKALDFLTEIAYRYKAKVHCLHVSKDGNYDVPTLNHWKEYYKDEPVDFSIYTAEESVDAVLEFIKEEKIDLLTVVSRNKGFFEKLFSPSFTKKILSQNKVPLLVFHE
ncbi:universal stress protein [Empedobacter falsenii]|uniref:Universal stress protein n=2 Tax=Empedobacter TaxID=59734 RepID=A0ABY8V4J7_9FLAO|nr:MULTISPECIES: universal stress protein [Empedobacter]MCA4776725.1 universal stress protein [Empedobacter stercoris]MCA4781112.1 universal stress protein [Empedobacter stercoris]MCA4810054.1 universal stress protein [Empedobacter stercoris]NOJ76177.1 universal stress protein [Empedobacter stercoris]QNT15213.1 universal stress protein [Empedobacter stercoris]